MPTTADLFASLQASLLTTLHTTRQVVHHAPTMGASTEDDWIRLLSTSLPNRYSVARAFVIDARGGESSQLDLVIYDRQYSPLLFHHGPSLYIPAESVYAVFEVKQDLDKRSVDDAATKIGSVRRLHRTSARITHAGGTFAPRPLPGILGGILTTESGYAGGPAEALVPALQALPAMGAIDLGCALNSGAFEATWTDGRLASMEVSERPTALLWFFLRLMSRLQVMGTVPALDLNEYAKAGLATRAIEV